MEHRHSVLRGEIKYKRLFTNLICETDAFLCELNAYVIGRFICLQNSAVDRNDRRGNVDMSSSTAGC